MILCMPTIGQKVRVLEGQEWKFNLYSEHRNDGALKYFHPGWDEGLEGYWQEQYVLPPGTSYYDFRQKFNKEPERRKWETTLPAGTVLTIDRIYLRKGASDFDSITFILNKPKGVKGPMVRFWVKLSDVNSGNLELLPLEEKPATKAAREDTQWG